MYSVLRKTLFRPSSHKRDLERLLSTAVVQTCGIELRVPNSCFCRVLKQAGVRTSRFDVIDHFCRGIQHIFQRSRQGRNEVRWRPGKETSLAPLCSNLKSFGSKCANVLLKKVFVTLLRLFGAPTVIWRPGDCAPLRYASGSGWCSPSKRASVKWHRCVPFTLGTSSWPFFESLNVIPALQEHHQYKPQKHISTETLQNQKCFYFSRTSALVAVCSSLQNRNSNLLFHTAETASFPAVPSTADVNKDFVLPFLIFCQNLLKEGPAKHLQVRLLVRFFVVQQSFVLSQLSFKMFAPFLHILKGPFCANYCLSRKSNPFCHHDVFYPQPRSTQECDEWMLYSWAQFGGEHGGRVIPLFQTGGHNMPCPPHFFVFRFCIRRSFKN